MKSRFAYFIKLTRKNPSRKLVHSNFASTKQTGSLIPAFNHTLLVWIKNENTDLKNSCQYSLNHGFRTLVSGLNALKYESKPSRWRTRGCTVMAPSTIVSTPDTRFHYQENPNHLASKKYHYQSWRYLCSTIRRIRPKWVVCYCSY